MPAYQINFAANPVAVKLLVAGKPEFLIGSFNEDVALMRAIITNTTANGTTGVVTVGILEGNIPKVGDLISITGTTQGGGALNAIGTVALTAVSINAATGVGTLSFLTAASFAGGADTGQAIVEYTPVDETFATGGSLVYTRTIPVTVQFNDPETNTGRTVTVTVEVDTNTLSTTLTANLQGALRNVDRDYVNINSTADFSYATTVTGIQQKIYTLQNWRYYRLFLALTAGTGAATGHVAIQ